MKYFVYSVMWRTKESSSWSCFNSLMACKSVAEVYEHATKQPEQWSIQHITEITKEEYDAAEERGTLG